MKRRSVSSPDSAVDTADNDPIANPMPNSAQEWYYKLQKIHNIARIGSVESHLTYNPHTTRIQLKLSVFTRDSPNFCHPSVKDK